MDTWVVVVITGEDEGMKIKRGSKDRALADSSTLWGRQRKRSLSKKNNVTQIRRRNSELSKVPFSRASCSGKQKSK